MHITRTFIEGMNDVAENEVQCELRKQRRLFSTDCASSLCKLVKHSRVSLSGKG